MIEEIKELRLTVARLEGAAKRLLDVLGCPVDGCKGTEATLEALRAAGDDVGQAGSPSAMLRAGGKREAADAEMEPQMDGDEHGCEARWRF